VCPPCVPQLFIFPSGPVGLETSVCLESGPKEKDAKGSRWGGEGQVEQALDRPVKEN
jgi:hypothetical protein